MNWPECGDDRRSIAARDLFYQAYAHQMSGQLEEAVLLYKRSIETLPTAEACTFLGWAYRFQGKLELAIQECKNAILIDPTLGNPYNDIGAYLIDLERFEEAIAWLRKATLSQRYASYHYPWFNMGRAYAALGRCREAYGCFEKATEIEPGYLPAVQAVERMQAVARQELADGVR